MAKTLVSMILILAFTIVMITAKIEAATTGITNKGLYTIVNAYNGKALTQTDMSTFWANAVVWNTDSLSDLARWILTERDDGTYSMTNSESGKSMKICGTTPGSRCDFNGYDNSNQYKWKLVPITSGTYAGCYYIVSSEKTSEGQDLYVDVRQRAYTVRENDKDVVKYVPDTDDSAQIGLDVKSAGENAKQIWKIEPTKRTDETFTLAMANTLKDAFKKKYYKYKEEAGCNTLGWGFWSVAEVMEAMLDGYELTGDLQYREMFENTWKAFLVKNGDYWTWNNYNDDIAWASLAGCRAYMMFGSQSYLEVAKKNFDFMYSRASKYTINGIQTGVLRWCEESDKTTTNGCINGPATVCAIHLAQATGDTKYWDIAKKIYMGQRNSKLYTIDGNEAGRINDCIKMDGTVQNSWVSTYNQGTYLGSAVMLYKQFGDQMYKTDAENIAKYTKDHLFNGWILKEENTNSGDLSGFRGILVRYMRMFILEMDRNDYLDFFKVNARIAWMNRNSQNLQQCSWQNKVPEKVDWDEFAGYNAVCVAANMPTYGNSVDRSAYNVIEAEDMDYTRGLIAENSSGTSGGRSLGGIQNGHLTGYYNVDFGNTGASAVTFKYSSIDSNGKIEFKLDSKDGGIIATASLSNTGDWSKWTTATVNTTKRVTGKHKVYVVFTTSASYVCNFDYFQFIEFSE